MMPTCAFKGPEVHPEVIGEVGEGAPPFGLGFCAVDIRGSHFSQVEGSFNPVREGGEVGGEVLDSGLVGLSKIIQRDLNPVNDGRGVGGGGEVEATLFGEIPLCRLGQIFQVCHVGKRRVHPAGGGVNIRVL